MFHVAHNRIVITSSHGVKRADGDDYQDQLQSDRETSVPDPRSGLRVI
jgi:hypothetical protein